VKSAQRPNRLRSADPISQQISRVLALQGNAPELDQPGTAEQLAGDGVIIQALLA
jgi:hypothetical protein